MADTITPLKLSVVLGASVFLAVSTLLKIGNEIKILSPLGERLTVL
jgi:hypothetical protein